MPEITQETTTISQLTAREIFTLLVDKKKLVLKLSNIDAHALMNNLRVIKSRENAMVEAAGFDTIDSIVQCKCLDAGKLVPVKPEELKPDSIIRLSPEILSWELSLQDPKPKKTYTIVEIS